MYLTHNKGKSAVAERFIRTLQYKIYKYIKSISKNEYIDQLDDLVNEYNNTYHSATKMKQVKVKYVKSSTFIYFNVENSDKDPKFEVGNIKTVRNIKTVLKKVTLQIGLKKCL